MTLLPILGRELRRRARSPTDYRIRFWSILVIALIGLPPLIWAGPSSAAMGRRAFTAVIATTFLLSCLVCLVTADSISAERRAGTLGLLFLTRVKGIDLLLGKFASNGLSCLLGLVALLPVFEIPILAGGVTGGEAVRYGLGLLNTLFLALSSGLLSSAWAQERLRAVRNALLLTAGLVLVPIVVAVLGSWPVLELASPLGTGVFAADQAYKVAPGR